MRQASRLGRDLLSNKLGLTLLLPPLVLGKSLPSLSCGVLVCKAGVTEARLQGRKVKASGSARHTGGSYWI